MTQSSTKARVIDFEELGYQTMLESSDEDRARNICGLHLHAYADQLQPELSDLGSQIRKAQNHASALHLHLYDRPIPVNDAAMLTHSLTAKILAALTTLAALACFAGNVTTFYLFGFALLPTLLLAAGTTALPLVVGHFAYERIVARHKGLQAVLIVGAAALCFAGLFELAQARRIMADKAVASTAAASSYVDGAPEDSGLEPAKPPDDSEARVRQTLGEAMLLIMIAADLVLGFLVGLLSKMRTDEDYAAWRELKRTAELIIVLERKVSELVSRIEIAKKQCAAGVLRALNIRSRRRIPYHRALSVFMLCALFYPYRSQAQTVDRYEGILIDTSGSISRGGTVSELFREYLVATRKLLLTEPSNSRVWVSTIATDSFGGVREIVRGWTPDVRGVFTDDLNRARRELAASFARKSSGMVPAASGTDIFGGLWHLKTRFESDPQSGASHNLPKTIWIFSDMMNETRAFPMPDLLSVGPVEMLTRAKANGLLVPLHGYKIYVYGASTGGLTPETWVRMKNFWIMYFSAAGAELVTYSAECDVSR